MHLTFQPVTLNVFPALPIVTVLSHIPGRVAKGNKDQHLVQTEFLLRKLAALSVGVLFMSDSEVEFLLSLFSLMATRIKMIS